MQLNALRYFVMVATKGSFAATAKHFQVPASSVSRFISGLEQEIGQQLFYRNTRSVRLTETGKQYYVQIRDVLDTLDLTNEEIAGKGSGVRGLVRINAAVALGRLHISRIVNKLQDAYPELSVELILTDSFIDPVQEGVDIVIRIGLLQDSALIARKVGDQKNILCASPEYLQRYGTPETPQDLAEHLCLVYKGFSGAQWWYFRREYEDKPVIVQPQGTLRSNNAEVLLTAALEGRGIVLFPTWIFEHDCFKERKLVQLLPEWTGSAEPFAIEINLVSPENRIRSQKVRTVLDFMLKEIGDPPYWDNIL
ncbi:LysR substrate-binding domain-containing protein [Acinetobacter terrestris]|uniref:LysR family transcriptional regulator n=1 Tax=Acinetobacter terrestris TaxID=2529843 RepID=UPI001040D8B5|nr:LysR family transcriptional regulator [Acinetobacter terrestris]TCB53381.1 LysR family transcriptional regulator [Acinetobacter terrestris]